MSASRPALSVLGGFSITWDGAARARRLPARGQALVAYLALHPDLPVSRGRLAGMLWPDSCEEQARTNLRKILHQLRQWFPGLSEQLEADRGQLQWPADRGWQVDACAFRSLADTGTLAALREAAEIYRGPLLPELALPWVAEEREVLHKRYREVLVTLVELLESRGELREALDWAVVLITAEPYSEDPYCRAFSLAAGLGDRETLEELWRRCTTVLGERPGTETARAYDSARAALGTRRERRSGHALKWSRVRDEREMQLFVGRGEHLDRLSLWLGSSRTPVLVVHGAPGVGKSTLLRVWTSLLRAERRPVVHLKGRRTPGTPQGLWRALGVADHAGALAWANESGALLLLDGFEPYGTLGSYLCDSFLPELDETVRVVVAARTRRALSMEAGSSWRGLVEEMELPGFTASEAREYLFRRGIRPSEVAEQVLARFGSTPLGLSLGADLALQGNLAPLGDSPAWHETVGQLVETWLGDVRPERLRELLFAASAVREFDQELLGALAGRRVGDAELGQLRELAVVRVGEHGLALDPDLRRFLAEDLAWRAPEESRRLRRVALEAYQQRMASASRHAREHLAAEHLFLSGDAILQDILFCPEEPRALCSASGGPIDLDELEAVLHVWGDQRMDTERPDAMIAATRAILTYRGTILRQVRRLDDGALVGFSAAVPLCKEALHLLLAHPGIAPYVERRWANRPDLPARPEQSRSLHITHAAYVDDRYRGTRARLIREIIGLLVGGGTYSLSTSDRDYQALAETLGFRRVTEVRHQLYGRHHPCEHYELDLSEVGFAGWIESLLGPSLSPVPGMGGPGASAWGALVGPRPVRARVPGRPTES